MAALRVLLSAALAAVVGASKSGLDSRSMGRLRLEAYVHEVQSQSAEAKQAAEAVRSQSAKAEETAGAALLRPNGPMRMNLTDMKIEDLPKHDRYVNNMTVTADWQEEYPLSGLPTKPPPKPVQQEPSGASAAVPALAGLAAAVALCRL
mmetsp:Transcript_102286/g.272201  ORF Transcript_102286/g.272201 Transcript_102286/m.272201 type:complete len:149 (-) Transcript_102286:84-530(-)